MKLATAFIAVVIGAIGAAVSASPLMQSEKRSGLDAKVRALAAGFQGELGLFAKRLGTGETIEWQADTRFPTASVIKLPIMVEAFEQISRGALSADAIVPVRASSKVGGSGILGELHDGAQVTIRDMIRLMIVVSDNTATNLLLEHVGVANVNARMRAYQLPNTILFRPTFGRKADVSPELEREFGLGMSTPRDMGVLLEMIASGRAVNDSASKEMRTILEAQQDTHMIPRKLPFDTREIVVANKTGTDEEKLPDSSGVKGHVRADVGIVRSGDTTFVIAIFARRIKDSSWMPDNAGLLAGAEISRLVFDEFTKQP
jgi:beta-lactamase class A